VGQKKYERKIAWTSLEKMCADTRFCTHDLIKENDWNDQLHTRNSWLHYMH